MISQLLLATALLLPTPDVRQRVPELQQYTIPILEASMQQDQPQDTRPLLWRIAGWANYGAAGLSAGSQYYRQDRSGSGYQPTPDNDALRISTIASGTYGANQVSDLLYKQNHAWGWISRLTSIGVLSYTAGTNFYNGWHRR